MQLHALDFLQAFGELALQEVRQSVFQNCKLIERFATNQNRKKWPTAVK